MMSLHQSPRRGLGGPAVRIGEPRSHRYELRSNQSDTRSPTGDADSRFTEDDIILPPYKRTRTRGGDISLESIQNIRNLRPGFTDEVKTHIFGGALGGVDIPLAQGPREPTLATERTRIESVHDGGYQFEQEYLQRRLKTEGDIEITDHGPLATEDWQSLEDDLHGALVESAFPSDREFLPGDKLRKIIYPGRVDRLFADNHLGTELLPTHDSIGTLICPPLGSDSPSYRRILAILLLIGNNMFKQIGNFIAEEVDDTQLPLNLIRSTEHRTEALTRSSQDGRILEFSLQWRLRYLKGFQTCQRQVLPTFFAVKSEDIAHYECRPGEILPFMAVEPRQELDLWGLNSNLSPEETNRGGNSAMFKYRIHESQQNLKRYTTNGPGRAVAVKKLQSTVYSDFQKERSMLVRLTPHTTLHLSKLLATFETPYISGDMTCSNYYLMFEWADLSLRDLWKRGHPKTIKPDTLSQWVAQQCQGLAEALDIIHEFKAHRRRSDPESRTHGFHGDIKPENLLWYANWSGCGYPFGVLQITDFGLSSFHNTATALDIKARMLDHTYSPPESILARRIGQSLDIWTLGCLFLEFAAWLGNGQLGLDEFEEARMTDQSLTGWDSATFYVVEQLQGRTSVAINDKVINWAEKLCRGRRCSQFICDFVKVILNQMLLVENWDTENVDDSGYFGSPSSQPLMSKRIRAGNLAIQLADIVKRGETQEKYHTRRISRPPNLREHHQRRLKIVINESRESVKEEVRRKKREARKRAKIATA